MALAINNNLMANNVTRNLQGHYNKLGKSTQRLSSGLRVNSAADDAAGLAIRELMRADIAALNQGVRNANDGISLIQTADGALGVIDSKLIRMKELAEQASTDTYTAAQRTLINKEYQAMADEITRIAQDTDFNGKKLLNGSGSKFEEELGQLSNLTAGDFNTVSDSDGFTTLTSTGAAKEATFINKTKEGFTVTQKFTANADETVSYKQATADTDGSDTTPDGTKVIIDKTNTNATEETNIEVAAGTALADRYKDAAASSTLTVEESTDGGKTWTAISPSTTAYTATAGASMRITTMSEGAKRVDTINVEKTAAGATAAGVLELTIADGSLASGTNDSVITIDTQSFTSNNIHFGSSSATTDSYNVEVGRSDAAALGVGQSVGDDVLSRKSAKIALDNINAAISKKDATRAGLGATQNRLEATIENISIQKENLQAAESRISDVDVATEMTEFSKQQILANAAVSMLSQANNLPKMAQKLLG